MPQVAAVARVRGCPVPSTSSSASSTSRSSRRACSADGSPRPRCSGSSAGRCWARRSFAAGRTVDPERVAHSLHAYFLLPGDPAVPIVYDVEPLRDGRSFTSRRVAARQHGRKIFYLTASFHVPEAGPEHQDLAPEVPHPDGCPTLAEAMAESRGRAAAEADGAGVRRTGGPARGRVGARRSDRRPAPPRGRPGLDARGGRRCPTTPCCTLPARVHERPDVAARQPRPARRPAPAPATCSSRRSTTRCGSTGRSGRTSGCSTTRCPRRRPARAGCRSGASSTRRGCSWPPRCRRVWSRRPRGIIAGQGACRVIAAVRISSDVRNSRNIR